MKRARNRIYPIHKQQRPEIQSPIPIPINFKKFHLGQVAILTLRFSDEHPSSFYRSTIGAIADPLVS
jgi:hypothetical protein